MKRTLLAQLAHPALLGEAFSDVRRSGGAPGVDGVRVEASPGPMIDALSAELAAGLWRPEPVRRLSIPKPNGGRRPIGILTVRDRVVARALQRLLLPHFKRLLRPGSHAYRRGRSARGAALKGLAFTRAGHRWLAVMDIQDFFGQIDRGLLMAFVHAQLRADPVLSVVGSLLSAPVLEAGRIHTPTRGVEQGSPLSPLLSNIYLHPWDVARDAAGLPWVRYSDNALLAAPTQEAAMAAVQQATDDLSRLGLAPKADAAQLRSSDEGVSFLGYHLSVEGLKPGASATRHIEARLAAARQSDGMRSTREQVRARRTILQAWLAYYTDLKALDHLDMASLVACIELMADRGDFATARALLRGQAPDRLEPSLVPLLNAALSRLCIPPVGGVELGLRGALCGRALAVAQAHVPSAGAAHPPLAAPARPPPTPSGPADVSGLLATRRYRDALQTLCASAAQSTPSPNAALAGALVAAFSMNPQAHGRMWLDGLGNVRYAAAKGAVDEAQWQQHLRGEHTLAAHLIQGDGRIGLGVLDLDARPEVATTVGQLALRRLLSRCIKAGHRPLIEDSGGKGYHLWLRFEPPARPSEVYGALRDIREAELPLPDGVRCELFPNRPRYPRGSPGPLIKLPLGLHRRTGRWSALLDPTTLQPTDPRRCLEQWQGGREVAPIVRPSAPSTQIEDVLRGCPLLDGLVAKAGALRHLHHLERMALLCVLGHLGRDGRAYLHAVIGQCDNYNRGVTERHIRQLKPSPVSCPRLKEWLYDAPEARQCVCPDAPEGLYPSPLLFAAPKEAGLGDP